MKEILEKFGLSPNEAIIYLALSELGTATAYRVADKAHLHRGDTHLVLDRLASKGLVVQKQVDDHTVYDAVDPTIFLQKLETERKEIEQIVPTIRSLQRSATTVSQFNTYKGVEAHISVLTNMLDYGEPILAYGVPKFAASMLGNRIELFHRDRIKRKIRMFHIYNVDARERINYLKKMPFTLVRTLDESYDAEVTTNVCGDEVQFIIWKPHHLIMQIKNKDMANAQKRYFKLMWKNAKKV